MHLALSALLALATAAPALDVAATPASGGAAPSDAETATATDADDEAALLWQPRLHFEDGVPSVSVAVVQGERAITLRADAPLRLRLAGSPPRELFIPKGGRWQVRARDVQPGEIHFRTALEELPYAEPERREAARARWAALGVAPVDFVLVGGLFGLALEVSGSRGTSWTRGTTSR
jgi:hypothetical protein